LSGGLWRQRVAVANEEMSPLEVRWGMIIFFPESGCPWMQVGHCQAILHSIQIEGKDLLGGTFFSDEGESSFSRRTISRQGRGRHGPTISRQRLHLVRLSKKSRKCPGVDHLPRRGTPRDDGDEKLSWRYQHI